MPSDLATEAATAAVTLLSDLLSHNVIAVNEVVGNGQSDWIGSWDYTVLEVLGH